MSKTRSRAPRLSANALTVLRRRYLAKNAAGAPIESPADMFRRVAENIAEAEHLYSARAERGRIAEQFYRLITQLDFLPNSPTLMNAGRDLQQLSACFVLPIEDSLESIFDAVKHQALIHQSGGGTGFSFSHLRPRHDRVASTSGVASGPVSFMKIFNMATEVIKQGGCVAPDTFVSTNRGMVPICELGPGDAAPHTWHPHPTSLIVATDDGSRPSDEFYVHGVAPVRRIRTRRGYRLSATLEHRIRVIDENGRYVWRQIKDLRPGDWAVLQKDHLLEPDDYRLPALNHTPHHNNNASPVSVPSEASARLGEFIGFVIGDGSFNRYNREGTTGHLIVTVCDDQPEIRAWLLKTCRELFGITPVARQKANDRSTNYDLNATALVSWLKQLGVEKSSALTARIPAIVFRKGRQMACGFLRGLFTAGGTVSGGGRPSFSSVSQGLIEDVQQLLLSVGIPSRVSVTTQRQGAFGKHPLYRLHIQTLAGLEQFARQIGFIDTARSSPLTRARRPSWEYNDAIPHQHHVIAALFAGAGGGPGSMRKSRGANRTLYRAIQHYLPGVLSPRNLTRSRLTALAEEHEEIRNSPLGWFLKHDQFYDQIETIEEDRSPTVDLSVPGHHTYIANGFVSHNTRRGANMGILRVDHPDILDFIAVKEDPKELTNFNLSVGITDAFMQALKERRSYAVINPRTGRPAGRLSATEVFDRLTEAAWRTGEPGVVFLDTINAANPTPHLGRIEATNPCGEQPLLPYESCTLGSINVGRFVKGPANAPSIDYDRLAQVIPVAVRFLDNVIDMNRYPLPEIETITKSTRKIGLGLMGFADLLIKLGIPYDTEAALKTGEALMRFVQARAHAASADLAKERGVFPSFKGSRWESEGRRLRNATVTTIAPTGTISIIADCSPGIEPLYGVSFVRTVMEDVRLVTIHPEFVRRLRAAGLYSARLLRRVAANESIRKLTDLPSDLRRLFVTAHDIAPEHHVRMQAVFQKYSDSGVSKTINLPPTAAKRDVASAFLLAYRLGCKGITVFRSGSREKQVLSCAQIQYC